MEKEINKQKIIKYVGAGILSTILVTSSGIAIYDAGIDHMKKVCPVTKMLSHSYELSNGKEITSGILHQLKQMKEEYNKIGENVLVSYDSGYQDKKVDYVKILATETILEDGTIQYSVPVEYGYKLVEIDGVYYGVKKVISIESDPYEAIVTYYRDEENNYSENNTKTRVLKLGD